MAEKHNWNRYLKVVAFLAKHQGYYETFEEECIKRHSAREAEDTYFIDIMREIYDELGIIPDEKNMYIVFLKIMEEVFGIDGKHIVEVGGGILPRLGKRIHLQQKKGSITVYDPRLGHDIEGEESFILKREQFTRDTPLKKETDLIVGLMPCKGAEALLDQALKNNIDFLLWLCEGGPHGDYFDYFEDDEEWLSSTIQYAKRGVESKDMGKLMIKYCKPFSTYPIVYNKREK